MKNKSLYVFSIGCQMNSYDSGQIKGVLCSNGYLETKNIEDATLIIVNTCSIRHKAEEKAFSFIGKIAKMKEKNPLIILAIGGCVAQQYGSKIFKRVPFVDLVFGTSAIFRLPELVYKVQSLGCKLVDIDNFHTKSEKDIFFTKNNESNISAFVTIMRGCDNYCTYCVVPYTRGQETSRNPESIIEEIKKLVSSGIKEVVLLGQNVNSYGLKNSSINFTELLRRINNISNLKRIRFTTSNPKDLSEELIDSFSTLDKLCSHIHLPIQSGNNTILKRMNRKYSVEYYTFKVNELRKKCNDISITSDFIIGFPGESDLQFEDTLNLVNIVRFDSSFIFSYSDRPNTAAYNFLNKVSEKIKKKRFTKLLELQNTISKEINCSIIGKSEKVLVEGSNIRRKFTKINDSKLKKIYHFGRTSSNKIVYFESEKEDKLLKSKGNLVDIFITEAKSHSLYGKLLK